ncbi:hypothetical protein [Cytobacillus oceanisediminis]|uniref:hypothetical protein n=1 Tax=Cytobacillus oceanisediminis TaxID=665099 RepID=UPI000D716D49|nr:hypothetical protein [Cytobacillus oceanisediminis]
MDKVTLNYEQLRAFTEWGVATARKKNPMAKKKHLESMGMQDVEVVGKGTRATFTFTIPPGFWRMVLIPSMDYREWGVDYINILIEDGDILNTSDGILVLFATEIYETLAKKHQVDKETVKTTCTRLRGYLLKRDYIRNGGPQDLKSHRVKRKTEWGWQKGPNAVMYDTRARKVWKDFFHRQNDLYRTYNPQAEKAPAYIYAQEARELYQKNMTFFLQVDYYRVAKRTITNDNLLADINYARSTFLETLDMGIVRKEIAKRQEEYMAEKERRDSAHKRYLEEIKTQMPSRDERKAIRDELKKIASSTSFQQRNMTQAQREELDRVMEEILDRTIEEVKALDGEE